ncbi:hypothetical protein BDZ97DRAFT_1901598 [Flammula alnicola]|nr:hypothetical protein BDZ97DRAFT_1901598 [Flammula alnicola]
MANVLQPHIDFHHRPVSHAPSPFGFGFGLKPTASTSMSSTGWGTSTPGHTNPAAFHQLASSVTQSASSRLPKRRLDPEDESENARYTTTSRDESMDRSPTPERPKRAAPKRARVVNPIDATSKSDATTKENKTSNGSGDDDIDVGMLLARMPPESLLPILLTLIEKQPSLKAAVIPLIPRPTLEIAVRTLAQAARTLRDSYPYSNTPTFAGESNHPVMRNSYVISRLRPHISAYVTTCMSYLPYFSCISPPSQIPTSAPTTNQANTATAIRSLQNHQFHPSETFLFLQAVTQQILNQPPLALAELAPLILPQLSKEWSTWVDKVIEVVQQGRMFGSETVRSWIRGLDELAEAKADEVSGVLNMKAVRDKWVHHVGWLVGRTPQQAMDEF